MQNSLDRLVEALDFCSNFNLDKREISEEDFNKAYGEDVKLFKEGKVKLVRDKIQRALFVKEPNEDKLTLNNRRLAS